MKQILPATSLALAMFLETTQASAQQSHPSSHQKTTNSTHMSTAQQNKTIIRRLFEEVINQRRFKELPAYISDSYTGPSGLKGAAGFEAPIAPLIHAFPDIQWQLQEVMAEGDQVVVKWQWKGTQQAAYTYIPATGNTITSDAMAIYTLKDGKVVKGQLQNDRLGFLQALGQLPQDIATISGKHIAGGISYMSQLTVPAAAKPAFLQRMHISRSLLRNQPGFIEDAVYVKENDKGESVFITIVRWQNEAALQSAKAAVQQANEKEGFDLAAFRQQLGIRSEPGVFEKLAAE
ncbi:ester cyclase [Chitinophaga deserti]|uniref:ester cyclase n=1 Tax=Chitinophaga deserti TaxID=2164099 RepID=UPI000D6C5AE3|nr:ester cyclase [Chitinophaga deserti]